MVRLQDDEGTRVVLVVGNGTNGRIDLSRCGSEILSVLSLTGFNGPIQRNFVVQQMYSQTVSLNVEVVADKLFVVHRHNQGTLGNVSDVGRRRGQIFR